MKIKREVFRMLGSNPDRVKYIKEKQPHVTAVYGCSIYFNDAQTYIAWNFDHGEDSLDDTILRAINAACNTEFEFID